MREEHPCPQHPNGKHKFGTLAQGNRCQQCGYLSGGPPPEGVQEVHEAHAKRGLVWDRQHGWKKAEPEASPEKAV